MTVDEVLAIAEVVLDGECLNDVRELIFRQCWEGRCSYEEIAKLSKYDDEYIKSIAAKLVLGFVVTQPNQILRNNLRRNFNSFP
ncbi:hypothetical protein [Planktothrix sp. PCC 11201]|uniref:hypothetical protein n=1 Tax=Planktothrix sp. PCC 11201 TaxID=1729650 RepID=UPI0009A90B27|nr:hypothetical protein [Planktothrix sp. PCC 11201]